VCVPPCRGIRWRNAMIRLRALIPRASRGYHRSAPSASGCHRCRKTRGELHGNGSHVPHRLRPRQWRVLRVACVVRAREPRVRGSARRIRRPVMANDERLIADEGRATRHFPMRPGTRRVALVLQGGGALGACWSISTTSTAVPSASAWAPCTSRAAGCATSTTRSSASASSTSWRAVRCRPRFLP
jgi:hypothetical protein